MPNVIAVLTGDLIDSTDLPAPKLETAFAALRDAAGRIARWQPHGSSTRFTRTRGDGWQICLAQPHLALRAALCMRAALRSHGKMLETRISIATGHGALPENGDLNSAHGPAFTASGRGLDTLSGHAAMEHADGGALAAAVRLADHISQGWTPAQARAVHLMLWPRDRIRATAAAELEITRQAVNQALWGAGFPALADALDRIEEGHDDAG